MANPKFAMHTKAIKYLNNSLCSYVNNIFNKIKIKETKRLRKKKS